MLNTSILIILISIIIMVIASIISKKTFMDREKSSPFECGFDPKSSARMPFSLQFFLIAVIFLIFDVEITLLIPFILIMKISSIKIYSFSIIFFLLILIMGLYHEWNQGALNWTL
uniref:NADH-ubiquinone oxidoreductase chain 3 n=1 Tax=Euryusa optabilis TaxID=878090 RepID=A0A0S2M7C2_9COLE|nr:NADH dehydrogenase subunit 3 [Euryusa optabilis]ALO70559.1 NADH deshydrogenase subunit 3 [Euryusa optabilis]